MVTVEMATNSAIREKWEDKKKFLWLLGPGLPIIIGGMLTVHLLTGRVWPLWFAVMLVHFILPSVDWIIGEDIGNPPESRIEELEKESYYSYVLYAFAPLQFCVLCLGTWIITNTELPWYHCVGLTLSVGLINGAGINAAHELGHKRSEFDRWMARIILAPSFYGHFYVEHNKGHHKWVATPGDPASSRMGESFWVFFPRSVLGGIVSAWKIERERLEREKKALFNVLENEVLLSWILSSALFTYLIIIFGVRSAPLLFGQALYAISLLEVINFLEHYGLLRQRDKDSGLFEKCLPEHSWNSNHIMTNIFLYHLQRHSDHHANPHRHFQSLRHFENSPQLPSGYAGMISIAYIPWLWFKIMDPLVIKHYKGDISKANLQPSRREELLAKYAKLK